MYWVISALGRNNDQEDAERDRSGRDSFARKRTLENDGDQEEENKDY